MGLTMRTLLVTLALIAFASCATAQKINRVSIGMTRDQVVGIMGEPVSVSAKAGAEYLNYSLYESDDSASWGLDAQPYFVKIVAGKVEAYGRKGDFDSEKRSP